MLTSCNASRVFTTVFNLDTEIASAMPGQHAHQQSLQYLFYYLQYMISASFINILPSAIEIYLVCNIISSTKLIILCSWLAYKIQFMTLSQQSTINTRCRVKVS
jgi:hypothetical protein